MNNDFWDTAERVLAVIIFVILALVCFGCATTPKPRIIDMRTAPAANSQETRSKPVTPQGHVIDFRR